MTLSRVAFLSGFLALVSFTVQAEKDETDLHSLSESHAQQVEKDLDAAKKEMDKGNLQEAVGHYLNAADGAKMAATAAQEHHAQEGSAESAEHAARLAKLSAELHEAADPKVAAEHFQLAAYHNATAGNTDEAVEDQKKSLQILGHVADHTAENEGLHAAHETYKQLADGYAHLAELSQSGLSQSGLLQSKLSGHEEDRHAYDHDTDGGSDFYGLSDDDVVFESE